MGKKDYYFEIFLVQKAREISDIMFKRKIWGGKINLSHSSIINFLKIYASNLWPLIKFLKGIPENSVVLDFGCGDGYRTIIFHYILSFHIIGIDISSYAIKIARRNLLNLTQLKKKRFPIHFALCEGGFLPLRDECFHCVFSIDVFGHLPNLDKAFSEISRILKIAGIGSFCTESAGLTKFRRKITKLLGYNPWDLIDGHISLYTFEQLRKKLEHKGLIVVDRKFEPRFLEPLTATTWSGGGGTGWLEIFIPELCLLIKTRRFIERCLEIVYSTFPINLLFYALRTTLIHIFLNISKLDTGEIYIKVRKTKS